MRVALVQLNMTVGDIDGNAQKIINAIISANDKVIDLFITSEMALMGYPPRDLLLNQKFIQKAWEKLEEIAKKLSNVSSVLVGIAEARLSPGRPLYNSAILLQSGKILGRFRKSLLPTYDVFDEDRLSRHLPLAYLF